MSQTSCRNTWHRWRNFISLLAYFLHQTCTAKALCLSESLTGKRSLKCSACLSCCTIFILVGSDTEGFALVRIFQGKCVFLFFVVVVSWFLFAIKSRIYGCHCECILVFFLFFLLKHYLDIFCWTRGRNFLLPLASHVWVISLNAYVWVCAFQFP